MQAIICEHHAYDSVLRLGSHAIAGELLRRGYRVAWLPHPRTPWLQRLRGEASPPAVRHHADGVVEVGLTAWAPHVDVPLLRSAFWNRYWLRRRTVRQRLAAAGFEACDLFWISDFTQLALLDEVPARRIVFRVFDQVDQFPRMPSNVFRHIHRRQHHADLVVASSRAVERRLASEGIAADYLPNAADLTGFDRRAVVGSERVERAVYLGALESWFDLPAVETWAAAHPAVDFVVAGPNPHHYASRLANVRFIGPVKRAAVPALLCAAKVGLIPFRLNRLTTGIHPLKLYDYLAAGLAVVSADLPEVDADERGVFKYRQAEEGVALLARALEMPIDRGCLYDKAEANAWSGRLDGVLRRLGLPLDLS